MYLLKSIIFAPQCASFQEVFICPADISNWLPQLIQGIKDSKSNQAKSHIKRLRIGSCGDHELPFFESGSSQYKLLIQLHDTIKQVSENPQDFYLKNPIYCMECKKLDFCEWNHCAPKMVFCSICQEPIDLQATCCTCINTCCCWKNHYENDILPFLRDCGAFICKYCTVIQGRHYFVDSCPNRSE